MARKHDIFQLVWKSKYSVNKETIGDLIKELNDELRYQSTVVLPRTGGPVQKQVLKTIQQLRERRDDMVKMYMKTYGENRSPRSGTEIDATETTSAIPDADKNYGTEESVRASKSFYKSFTKQDELKDLYQRAWGTTMGLNQMEKMSTEEMDGAIRSLKAIFE